MDKKHIKILMVDDHPSQIEGYKIILSYNPGGHTIETTEAYTCKDAFDLIVSGENRFDLVFLDRSLPGYPGEQIKNGEDLGLIIKKILPKTKIVMLTSHSETFLLYNIVKKLEPAGLLVKSDFSAEELLVAFEKVLNGEIYYSDSVRRSIKELLSREQYLDATNRQIIMLLSQGVRTKSIPEYLNLSQSSIEKRKAQIKDYLCVTNGGDEDIVREAKRLGFI